MTSILLLDSQKSAGITLTSTLDAASAPTMPKGPVPAGGGGTAPGGSGSGHSGTGVLAGFGALGVLSAIAVASRRRTSRVLASR